LEGFTSSAVSINITDSYVSNTQGDVIGGPGVPTPQPYGHAIFMYDGTYTITVGSESFNVTATSNSTISNMILEQSTKSLNFTTSGPSGTTGYVNITIPKILLNANLTGWYVLVDTNQVTPTITADANNTYIYINYSQSTHGIHIFGQTVIPEYQSIAILVTLLTMMTVAVAMLRKVHKKGWQTL